MLAATTSTKAYPLEEIRSQFPLLQQSVHSCPLVYLDNAATTQKPRAVLDALQTYYSTTNSNVHRGAHYLAEKATAEFENSRNRVAQFLNASSSAEVIFTKGTTESINLVANAWGRKYLKEGSEILLSELEHHSNIVPWQLVAERTGAKLNVIPIDNTGTWNLSSLDSLLTERTKIVALSHASNSLGTVNPIEKIIARAHKCGAIVLIDGAQAAAHLDVDVRALDCDFYAFSAHKLYGPTGVGVLYGKLPLLEAMDPYQGGGEMIEEVTFEKTTYNIPPHKFEAGTPNIADVVAFKPALDFLSHLKASGLHNHEQKLLALATELLTSIPGVSLVGTAKEKIGVVSFLVNQIHPYDVGALLDAAGIAVRTGHHCTQPLMKKLGIEGTIRASFAAYNTEAEVQKLVNAVKKISARKNA